MKDKYDTDWIRQSVGTGSKGEWVHDWLSWRTGPTNESGCHRYALAHRSVNKSDEYAFYYCYAPENPSTRELAVAAGKRWNIECYFETAKHETGLDEYEIRSWHGWYRHITMSMLVLAFLSAVRCTCHGEEANKIAHRLYRARNKTPFKYNIMPYKLYIGILSELVKMAKEPSSSSNELSL